jgi:hypothetical protein
MLAEVVWRQRSAPRKDHGSVFEFGVTCAPHVRANMMTGDGEQT